MSERKIPAVLLSMLENEGISQAQILAYSPIDLSFECEYVYGYVFLTKKHLGVATSAPISSHIIYMKGTQKKDDVSFEEKSEYSYRLYEVDKIEKLHREHMVATNLICMEYDGKPVRLAAHTNLHLADMEAFLKKYKQFIHGEQITEEEAAAEPEELYCPVCGTKYPDEERKICPKCMNKRSIFMRTFRYFLRYKWMIAVLAFCYVASALVSLAWPYLSGTVLYDWVLDKNDTY